ncbi:MAG: nitroreductase family protein [Oscillospiraceae bacterium]|nr:nitroreductase family protein [Oscillospiraceae bacterium]
MDFLKLAESRYSVREYTSEKVEKDKLRLILEAGRIAPTAANIQPVRVIAVESSDGLAKIGRAANLYNAPLALIVLADRSKAWTRPFDNMQTTHIDASIVTDHMMLEAASLGLGSVWICYFKSDVLRKEFDIPDNYDIVNILAVGCSADCCSVPVKKRKALESFVSYETL